jgi:excisionase family DNA binding protein
MGDDVGVVARLRGLMEALPPGGSVMLSREALEEWLAAEPVVEPLTDLTVARAAEVLGRRPSTVRGWCASGELRAYRFRAREWRIPAAAIREFQDHQAEAEHDDVGGADLGGWRDIVARRKAA